MNQLLDYELLDLGGAHLFLRLMECRIRLFTRDADQVIDCLEDFATGGNLGVQDVPEWDRRPQGVRIGFFAASLLDLDSFEKP